MKRSLPFLGLLPNELYFSSFALCFYLELLPGFLQSKLALFHLSFKFGKIRITRVQYHFIRVVILLHTLNSYFDKHF